MKVCLDSGSPWKFRRLFVRPIMSHIILRTWGIDGNEIWVSFVGLMEQSVATGCLSVQ